ncbi:hypothetical protein M408DRAFT_328178 [Serendipita vermifera MAFF 305830]|uniref:Uncharacterized protein n=1 Tax=Serendipita vermifera MAFF 305830 TaxID=933852 RepID=A0A0C2WX18_SERVB|nr:hypothetical protein M408DRAFT_328178 [Serendipita vermifera MAFF 305830]
MYWKDRLDRGRLVFRSIESDFYVIPISRDDSDTLAEERRSNRLEGPNILEVHGGISSRTYPRLSPQLAWVHQVITRTWQETGLAERKWTGSIPCQNTGNRCRLLVNTDLAGC